MLKLQSTSTRQKPWLIAHRGGVIAEGIPENTLAAIRLAVQHGYDLVELDVRETKDHYPILFHGPGWNDNLFVDCGVDRNVGELSSEELSQIRYRMSDQTIVLLTDALSLCADLGLGVMLDIKTRNPSKKMISQISDTLSRYESKFAALTLGVPHEVETQLQGKAIFPVKSDFLQRRMQGEVIDLNDRYFFEWGSKISENQIQLMHQHGGFVIAAINSFHYPRHATMVLAAGDIQRLLRMNVNGFQIDHEFKDLVST